GYSAKYLIYFKNNELRDFHIININFSELSFINDSVRKRPVFVGGRSMLAIIV
ncbi:MAG: hypothetical protein ACI9JU_002865, partial [Pseudohongiellaceae bacterium]